MAKVVPAIGWWPLLEKVKNRATITPCAGAGDASQESGNGAAWSGGTWEWAINAMTNGWADGAKQVDAVLATMPEAEALADAWNLEAAGRFPCVPALLSGDPECMWQAVESEATKPRICLVVSACYHCGIGPEEVLRFGAAVAATLRALEARGHGVAIYSVDSRDGRENVSQAVIVRDFGQPLDTSVVAFAFHPAFLRRVLFANSELTPEWADAGLANSGYGYPNAVGLAGAAACLGGFPAMPVVLSDVATMSRLGLLRADATDKLLAHIRTEVAKAIEAN
jgi:hypothetical protein